MLRIRAVPEIQVPNPVARSDALTCCQGARYNASCPGGLRLCRYFKGLWLCEKKCWRHRREIAVLAQTDSHRKEANSQLRVTSTISGSVA